MIICQCLHSFNLKQSLRYQELSAPVKVSLGLHINTTCYFCRCLCSCHLAPSCSSDLLPTDLTFNLIFEKYLTCNPNFISPFITDCSLLLSGADMVRLTLWLSASCFCKLVVFRDSHGVYPKYIMHVISMHKGRILFQDFVSSYTIE